LRNFLGAERREISSDLASWSDEEALLEHQNMPIFGINRQNGAGQERQEQALRD
jgi:hypothetical protein